jgi:hypothetical protein
MNQNVIKDGRWALRASRRPLIRLAIPAREWLCRAASQSHGTAKSQSANPSWCQAPSGAPDQMVICVCYCRNVFVHTVWLRSFQGYETGALQL